ncbi:peptidoglycan bridge formation glycyltransferase FemA/FemB family protein [Patescibacteria group bacterium]|nr:peptidoglycan bridge formation glycyltransferase FemA/FemB family protein [Patescibacteria group bacterium]MBU4023481.1 peptidoglycan bridge formation glycyltransferase FemA/FemB family protein [Patescibacteria group bacterium]MBU4078414.1 peptidoglycan bridge formation glycyltransferase FemA/FemB family protein [Patescibacteria group bacterium]
MIIKEIENKDIWENFLMESHEKSFLHSWNWAEFQKELGEKIWRLAIIENDVIQGLALIIKVSAKRGIFFLCPHGLIIKNLKSEDIIFKTKILEILLDYLKDLAKKEKASFIRICPIWQRTDENIKIFKSLGFKNAPIHMHPENNWILDLSKTEEELLMGMRKNTRYAIRKAEKQGVIIEKNREIEAVDIFNKVYHATVKRHDFVPFSLDYLKKEFLAFDKDEKITIFLAKYNKEVISCAMIIFWQKRAYYHQGASLRKYDNIFASHLLQWEAIKQAKAIGCDFYSFWGIAPKDRPKHPWQGITLFKKGFGGEIKEYVKTQDFIINNKYWFNYFIEKSRSIKRGF